MKSSYLSKFFEHNIFNGKILLINLKHLYTNFWSFNLSLFYVLTFHVCWWFSFLQSVEQDLDIHHRLFNQISERAQKIKDNLEKGSLGVIEITEKLEKLTQRWDALVLLMESVSKKVWRFFSCFFSNKKSFNVIYITKLFLAVVLIFYESLWLKSEINKY